MTTPTGWGTAPWGTSEWGTGTALLPTEGARVYATGDRRVRVILSFVPQARYPTQVGDALNPKTWQIEQAASGRQIRVLAAIKISPTEFELHTLETLANSLVGIELRAPDLLTSTGAPVLGFYAIMAGQQSVVNSTQQLQTTAAGYGLRDLANPQTPNSPVGGTLQMTAGGDYKSVTGSDLLRKLILRRLMSSPGDFFHLPEYGAGLQEKVPMAETDLRRLAKLIESQIQLEPEVEAARVNLTLRAADNTLVVQMTVLIAASGERIELGLGLPINGLSV